MGLREFKVFAEPFTSNWHNYRSIPGHATDPETCINAPLPRTCQLRRR